MILGEIRLSIPLKIFPHKEKIAPCFLVTKTLLTKLNPGHVKLNSNLKT
jgi:hypothetical protein